MIEISNSYPRDIKSKLNSIRYNPDGCNSIQKIKENRYRVQLLYRISYRKPAQNTMLNGLKKSMSTMFHRYFRSDPRTKTLTVFVAENYRIATGSTILGFSI